MRLKRWLRLLGLISSSLFLVTGCPHPRPPVLGTVPASPATQPAEEAPSALPEADLLAVPSDQLASSSFDAALEAEGPLADVHFDFDQAVLTETARATLAQHAGWLRGHAYAGVIIEGHCDERGTSDYNLALGSRRAQAAHDYLVSLGLDPTTLEVVSLGKERPLDPGHDESAWARNRRAHFVVKGAP